MRYILAAGALLFVAACGGRAEVAQPTPTGTAAACPDLSGAEAGASVRLLDFEFSPDCFVMDGRQGLSLQNDGSVVHNFTIAGTQVDLDTPPGAETNTEAIGGVVPDGTHRFFCSYHEDQGMSGEVRVVS